MERLLEQMSRLEAHRSNAAAIGARIAEKTLERKQIRVSDAEIEEAQGRFTEMSASFYGIKVRVESLERYVKERRSVLEGRREEVGKVQKMLDDADRKEQTAMELAKFKEAVGETKNILRARLIDSINRVMQDTWNELYPYGDYQSVMLDSTPDDYVLKVLLKSNGKDEWRDVETIASGGERSIACLNLRVAFSLVLVPNLRWIILDEPTHNIDKKGLERFIRVFNETLPNIVDQIFIITHDEILKQIGNSKIYVFARDKEGYEPTVVSDA
jgi:exonuclease SbcC